MLTDPRERTLARNLVKFSCNVQKGENVRIEAYDAKPSFVAALIEEVYAAGGYPFVSLYDNRIQQALMTGMNAKLATAMKDFDAAKMSKMQCYIGVRGGNNPYELSCSKIPDGNVGIYGERYGTPVHHEIRVPHTKWVVLRWPDPGMSALSGMSTEDFEDYYFDVCNLDYRRMEEAMDPLVELMNATDKVRLVAPGTDLTFSIKGIPAVKCCGHRNIPDGEVYTAPVRDSVNGVISYNVPTVCNGVRFTDVSLTFKDGKIVKATSNDNAAIERIFSSDEGARYVGEFSLGLNPLVTKAIGDILFDEKISGSIHFTPGNCYDEADNGNKSSLHWDLVLDMRAESGGGKIYFDDRLIREDGIFVVDELKGLNPLQLAASMQG